jgi:SAM-dependent methyltransferase
MCKDRDSPNHAYIARTVSRLVGSSSRVLDYGCGAGAFVTLARAQGFDAWGADTYAGQYQAWRADVSAGASPYVRSIRGARLPWPDASFDAVTCNQVFEHMAWSDVQAAVAEIARVLRPGGLFLALFPTRDIWWEGHYGAYFIHRLAKWPRLLRLYLTACRALGAGYHCRHLGARAWAAWAAAAWPGDIRHHRIDDARQLWRETFGAAPSSLAVDYMRYRLPLARWLPGPALGWVCHKRAGRVLAIRRPADAQVIEAGRQRSYSLPQGFPIRVAALLRFVGHFIDAGACLPLLLRVLNQQQRA